MASHPTVPDEARACIFCGSVGSLTREHVIPRWVCAVLDDLEPDDIPRDWGQHYTAGGFVGKERDRQYGVTEPTVIVRAVCEACNAGWLAGLEGRVKPVLEPMIRGVSTTLDAAQQVDIATWASKTIIGLEFHDPIGVVSRPEDRELVREEVRPPHHHRVRLAYRSSYLESSVAKTLIARTEDAPDERPDAFATLLALGFVIVQVWGGHGVAQGDLLAKAGTAAPRSMMAWPPIPAGANWPPALDVSDEELDAFAREVIPWADDSPDLAQWRGLRNRADPA